MSPSNIIEELTTEDLAALLASTYRVPTDDTGVPVPLDFGRILFLPLFDKRTPLPEPPPGATRWTELSGHELLPLIPPTCYVHPTGTEQLIPVETLTAPTTALLQAASSADPARFAEAFSAAVLYCPAGRTSGFLARPDGTIAVFSSLPALLHGHGDAPWFATTGADLLGLLPDGHHFVLDPGGPHETSL